MQFIRSLLFSVYMIIATIITASLCILLWPFPYCWRYGCINIYAKSVLNALRLLCGISYKIEGREHALSNHPAIIFCKHQSTWETFALQTIFPRISFVFKSELLWVPFFGWGLATMKPIAINRGSGNKAVRQLVSGGIRRLKAGIGVVIFPEGTRTQASAPGRYRIGGAVLAAESGGYPVIPVAHHAGEFWPRKGFFKKPGTITVRVGPPITTTGKTAESILRESKAWIEAQMPELTQGPYHRK